MYLLVFIQNPLMHLAEKILLTQPLTFGADYTLGKPVARARFEISHIRVRFWDDVCCTNLEISG